MVMSTATLNAQEYKTDERIASQLKNNRQPGMRYGESAKPVVSPSIPPEASTGLNKLIKEGRLGGMRPGTGGVGATGVKPAAESTGLASELKSEDLKPVPAAKPLPVPQQSEEIKQETPKKD